MNDNIIIQENCGIKYIQFKKLLDYGVKHAYTLKGENIDFSRQSENEKESYEKISKALNIDERTLVNPHQKHTKNVKCIDKITDSEELQDIDGLITNKPDITLITKNADCILMLFYDPIKKVIANVHSGWRGTVQKISEEAVTLMIKNYDCKPENINCFICPCIRKCHFEVDEDVKDIFKNTFEYLNQTERFIEKGKIIDEKQKYMIDTVEINRILLKNLGLKEENIVDCGICSVCNKEMVHSARAEGKKFKHAVAIITL